MEQQSTHLLVVVKTLAVGGNKNTVSVLGSDTKEPWIEMPLISLGDHWLIQELFNGGWFRPHVRGESGTGISDCFSRR